MMPLAFVAFWLVQAAAAGPADPLQCELHPMMFNRAIEPNPPHTHVTRDLNNDGVDDYFYLAGDKDSPVTCLFLGSKGKDGSQLKLVSRETGPYPYVGDLTGSGRPEFLIPQALYDCGKDNGLQLIGKQWDGKAGELHARWSAKFAPFAHERGKRKAVASLYLLNSVHVYRFEHGERIDVTEGAKDYLELKKNVLGQVISAKATPAECRARLKEHLKRLTQFGQVWEPVSLGYTLEECIQRSGLQLGSLPKSFVRFSDDCKTIFVRQGKPKIITESVAITGTFAGVCPDGAQALVQLRFADGLDETVQSLQRLNPGRSVLRDPRYEFMTLSYSNESAGFTLTPKDREPKPDPRGQRRALISFRGEATASAVLDGRAACPRIELLRAHKTDPQAQERLADLFQQGWELRFDYH